MSPGEWWNISTMDEMGIAAVHLDSQISNTVDSAGNTQERTGSFQWADGTAGEMAEYRFQRDTADSEPVEILQVPSSIANLPDLAGYGFVYSLRQSMVREVSGELISLVESFASEEDPDNRTTIMDEIIFEWTGANAGGYASALGSDVLKAHALRELYGFSEDDFNLGSMAYPAASGGGGASVVSFALQAVWEDTYRQIREAYYGTLMAQTHFKDLFDELVFTWDDDTLDFHVDTAGVVTQIQEWIAGDPVKGSQLLSEVARSLRTISLLPDNDYLSFREAFIQQDPSLGWVFDTGGLEVYDDVGQGLDPWWPHIQGTNGADAVLGSLTKGEGLINAHHGDGDVIYGTSRDERLVQGIGDAVLVAGGGNDTIWANEGDDILDGGEGNDTLYGQGGNDTYIFRVYSGHDTIIESDPTPGNTDTIWLGSNLTPEDIVLRRVGNNLVLSIETSSDTLTVRDFFRNNSTLNQIERIQFMDGRAWTYPDIMREAFAPTEGDDTIYGWAEDDDLSGLGGNDQLYGLAGDDTLNGDAGNDLLYGGTGADILTGGSGDDVMYGGSGNDSYRSGRGSGQDTIHDTDTTPGNWDIIEFGSGVLPSDVQLERLGDDLKRLIIAGYDHGKGKQNPLALSITPEIGVADLYQLARLTQEVVP
ncbi:calcium-binding protein [Thermodesulfobacteriota bacterium]